MSRGLSPLERFWLSEWSLSALLAMLILDGFVIGPIAQSQDAPGVLQPAVFSLVLISGVATALRSRAITGLVVALVAVGLVTRWMSHLRPSLALARADTAFSLGWAMLLAAVILVQVFRPGRVNLHRIQGAVAVYLLLALMWAFAYKLVVLSDPEAFSFPASAVDPQHLLLRLKYFSTVTLTTVGYGDITPVSPVARSLASLEALTGQLFPAILLARLVSMELYHRTQRASDREAPPTRTPAAGGRDAVR
jgi:voltage-gated potassium channel Kch